MRYSFLLSLLVAILFASIAEGVISIDVTPTSITYTGDPGSQSSITTLVINNTGTETITSVKIYQNITDIEDTWSLSINGTSFIKMDDNGLTNYRYGRLRANTGITQCPGVTYPAVSADAKYGAINIVYETTAVGGETIYRSIDYYFVFDFNTSGGGTYDKLIIDIDADKDLTDSNGYAVVTSVPSSSITFTENRYNKDGQITSYSVGSYNITEWDALNGSYIVTEYSDGSAYTVGTILVGETKSVDVVFYIPNNIPAKTYYGEIYFIAE